MDVPIERLAAQVRIVSILEGRSALQSRHRAVLEGLGSPCFATSPRSCAASYSSARRRFARLEIHENATPTRSFIVRVLNELLVDPVAPVVPAPDATVHNSTGNRSSRNNDCPQVPFRHPNGFCRPVQHPKAVVALRFHWRHRSVCPVSKEHLRVDETTVRGLRPAATKLAR